MNRVIEVTVSPTGTTSVQTKGFHGASCHQASRFLEAALGQKTNERLTPEFHQTQPQASSLQAGQG